MYTAVDCLASTYSIRQEKKNGSSFFFLGLYEQIKLQSDRLGEVVKGWYKRLSCSGY